MIDNSNIDHITIVVGTGNDVVIIDTKLPCPYKNKSLGNLKLKFECGKNMGISYVRDVFMIYARCNFVVKVIDVKKCKSYMLE